MGVVRQRDPEHGDRKGQRYTRAVSRRMAYLIRRRLTPVERQTVQVTLDGLTALWMKSEVLRGMTPCPLVNSYGRFGVASYPVFISKQPKEVACAAQTVNMEAHGCPETTVATNRHGCP